MEPMKKLMMTSEEYYSRHDGDDLEANGCLCWFIAFMAASFFWIAIYLIFVR